MMRHFRFCSNLRLFQRDCHRDRMPDHRVGHRSRIYLCSSGIGMRCNHHDPKYDPHRIRCKMPSLQNRKNPDHTSPTAFYVYSVSDSRDAFSSQFCLVLWLFITDFILYGFSLFYLVCTFVRNRFYFHPSLRSGPVYVLFTECFLYS